MRAWSRSVGGKTGASARAGYTTAFLTAAAVMVTAGALALTTIRPERDAHRLGLDHAVAGATPRERKIPGRPGHR
ncbi:hypothetical protein [Streptomyces sp. Qhu_M48]|uniref:hypothetical protein n=1 Tax=Streptomyces sp. Qhu_M48 TaxID=3435889 RepID=UPI003F4FF31D